MDLRRVWAPRVCRPKVALVLLLMLVGAVGGGFVSNAHSTGSAAMCAKWDVSGVWNGSQSNVRGVQFTFKQSGTVVTGHASYSGASGPLTGSLKGSKLDFIISWSDGKRGHYFGTASAHSITGDGFDIATPSSTATWSATGTAVCSADSPTDPPPLKAVTPTLRVSLPATESSLRLGDSGSAVLKLQRALAALGLYNGRLDGTFGAKLQAAVAAFEKAHGLTVDGVAGLSTAAKINAALAGGRLDLPPRTNLNAPDSGAKVEDLQRALTALGFYKGKIDGTYGSSLAAAVAAFEKANGLKADGEVGPTTAAKINAALKAGATLKVDVPSGKSLSANDTGDTVENLQRALAELGYYKDKLDAKFGPSLEAAVAAFEKSHGLKADGIVGPSTAAKINAALKTGATLQVAVPSGNSLSANDSGLAVENLQRALTTLGLYKGNIDGTYGPSVVAAVRAFEKAHGLPADGVVGPTTVTRINAALTS